MKKFYSPNPASNNFFTTPTVLPKISGLASINLISTIMLFFSHSQIFHISGCKVIFSKVGRSVFFKKMMIFIKLVFSVEGPILRLYREFIKVYISADAPFLTKLHTLVRSVFLMKGTQQRFRRIWLIISCRSNPLATIGR